MSATGLENFDRTLHKTHGWLNEIGTTVGDDKQAQFHSLRDGLMIEEAFHLSSHLPTLIRGIYWEDYRPSGKPETYRTREEVLRRVSDLLEDAASIESEAATRPVFAAIEAHVSEGEMAHVIQMMPEGVRDLFPSR